MAHKKKIGRAAGRHRDHYGIEPADDDERERSGKVNSGADGGGAAREILSFARQTWDDAVLSSGDQILLRQKIKLDPTLKRKRVGRQVVAP